ncbi:hypothetical protein CMU87_17040 [Elizabethkingia anophelis]|nr:hypothetical protein [Elizabethkingia anophelis]
MEISNYAFWILVVYFALGIVCYRLIRKSIPNNDRHALIQGFVIVFWLPLILHVLRGNNK